MFYLTWKLIKTQKPFASTNGFYVYSPDGSGILFLPSLGKERYNVQQELAPNCTEPSPAASLIVNYYKCMLPNLLALHQTSLLS
jgi:hypothetical protein